MKAVILFALTLISTTIATDYVFVSARKKFGEAQAYCRSTYGGNLASITSAAENVKVKDLCENTGQLQGACWLGLKNPWNTFLDGSAVTYSDAWYVGEPDGGAAQPCATIRQGGDWHTVGYCENGGGAALPFVCEMPELIFVPTPATKDVAEADCVSTYNGHLASIHNAQQNTAVAGACENIGQIQACCIMGLSNPGVLNGWTDGTPLDYNSWYPGEPDGGTGQPVVSIRQGGDWHTGGQGPLPYVCSGTRRPDWVVGLSLGHPDNKYNGVLYDISGARFNQLFQRSASHIIKRECSSCHADYKEIYYRRFTNPQSFDAYGYMKQWRSANNLINTDFGLYSTLANAIHGINPWQFCNYDDVPGVGAFRDCGKTGGVACQWTSDVANHGYNWAGCSRPSKFSIYIALPDWVAGLSLGHPDNRYNGELIDIGGTFNQLFQQSTFHIIRRDCPSCSADYKEIYYRRFTNPQSFDAYAYMKQWRSANNHINADFGLYSTLADAMAGTNAWQYCNYDDVPGVGAFRDCGKIHGVGCQWTSDVAHGGYNWANCNRPSKFSIYVAETYNPDSGVGAHYGLSNFDFPGISAPLSNGQSSFVMYGMYLIAILLAANAVCFGIYFWKKRGNKRRYKVVSVESDTDHL